MGNKNNIFQNLIYSCLGIPKGFREKRIPAQVLKEWVNLQLYNPAKQVELHDINNEIDPAGGTPWMHLVTMERRLGIEGRLGELLKNFEQKIATWDTISTSLVSHHRSGDVIGGGGIGYILDVPPQNILSTNEEDVFFENHIGYKINPEGEPILNEPVVNPYALAESIKKRIQPPPKGGQYEFYGKPHEFARRLKADKFLVTPSELDRLGLMLGKQLREKIYYHNEVLVISRPGLSLYQNMPQTGLIKVKGIYVVRDMYDGEFALMIFDQRYPERYANLPIKMSVANNHVPIIYV